MDTMSLELIYKKSPCKRVISYNVMVGAEELESPTSSTSMTRSSQLSYAPITTPSYQIDSKLAITGVSKVG